MLYHVPDRTRALSEFARVLKPRGRLFASTNGENHMAEVEGLVETFNRMHGDILAAWPKLNFSLESGTPELARRFQHVELHRCEPGIMRVTEGEPLAACITSVALPDAPTRAKLIEHCEPWSLHKACC